MAKKDIADIKQEVKQMVAEITELSMDKLTDDARFVEDLGIDSMMALEIVAGLEKKYRIVIPEEDIPTVRSLSNVYGLMEKLIKK